eukprot:TRINITY_DN121520_c0_g1_i1.p1 TRINITY_DN121520_c0_g1~~TRINITY_DN121520_c0_g1_i1.p1  ORF type:complete len:128 (+),score=21.75 TRINITY_DN121520_c0_g1_i1:52-435(+)
MPRIPVVVGLFHLLSPATWTQSLALRVGDADEEFKKPIPCGVQDDNWKTQIYKNSAACETSKKAAHKEVEYQAFYKDELEKGQPTGLEKLLRQNGAPAIPDDDKSSADEGGSGGGQQIQGTKVRKKP